MDAVTNVPPPRNEPVLSYAPGTPERAALQQRLTELAGDPLELTMTLGEKQRMGSGERFDVVQPHRHAAVLGTAAHATHADAQEAVACAKAAAPAWQDLSFDDRAAVFLRAAELLAGPWRQTLNAATMLGQSKTAHQAEIDSACELVDFWRWNVHFAREIVSAQPVSSPGVWNRSDHRPLEGFVYAVTPFNFTAIAGNLPTAPALMGNTVVWKPAPTQQFAAHFLMRLLEEAGLPPGVITMVTGDGIAVSDVVLADRDLAGIHFTGSTPVFQHLWRTVGENIASYRGYPRIVGETGGKDFVVAHPSADVDVLRTALVRGAFEFQGQKCSAASRAYVPRSVWARLRDDLVGVTESLPMGDVTDFSNFMGAVIDRKSFSKLSGVLDRVDDDPALSIVAGGQADDSEGFFVRPTVIEGTDPGHEVFTTEYFGPILAVHVYDDADYDTVLTQMESAAPYALTGAVIAEDRAAIAHAQRFLRFAAGNFYVNDKPTGAVVGQQPFGGGRASGTNDKAGAAQNLQRWTSTRSIKETFVPPTDHRYPHQG
ncbi:L-glutamate gamma-semialdehyde dehydrogenase [Geodermatophilus obscurus]|uniref:L-glutamate gamma-semialdehyde dehydrogenase n=1 Tax=Geodermatophilus obscurus (strain ATCC 25078 / DSM 43160 / JCM 3152 / CCUG 61914 / KCC A-0152 / KCTC 9177 / NBRC 13315 / NRRL B-3577 / G-20) TaxID=526225 RepID=D2SBY9_GEOOG|nr:L-glutamate gamma-semialdehyde dehydrogenase [Geodermatophilus obscurus]ADB74157.1 delta-1-pyrroline-5-carboxylate dehydrogenase [Geodermatophilus obscurus DSM 43160]